MMTATVPRMSASGRLRPGSRISSAIYAAAFQPEYVNITGISASTHAVGATAPAALPQIFAGPGAERKSHGNEHEQRRHLERREHVADDAARTHAANVHQSEQRDRG